MKKALLFFSIIVLAACGNADSSAKENLDSGKAHVSGATDDKQAREAAQKALEIRKAEEAKQAAIDDTVRKPLPIPNYKILTTDSVWVTPANLKPGKPVMVVYFSPDCSHCQRMMYELQPKLSQLTNVQIVMITWSLKYDIRGIKIFKRDYDLKKYPNFTIGTEGYTAQVQQYYKIQTTPFIALYDSKRKWVKYFDKTPKTEDVLMAARGLK